MKIDEKTWARMPPHLQAMFVKAPNPLREEVVGAFPHTESGYAGPDGHTRNQPNGFGTVGEGIYGGGKGLFLNAGPAGTLYGDAGSAARFFYCAKADRADRDEGLEGMPLVVRNITEGHGRGPVNTSKGDGTGIRENLPVRNHHPTVKPHELMRWLCRLVTPPAGLILDPFCGSGSTGKAAVRENFRFIGIDRELEYLQIAAGRIHHANGGGGLFAPPAPAAVTLFDGPGE
jgi:site-specific DNA-methyltransferase (adenine-specific)